MVQVGDLTIQDQADALPGFKTVSFTRDISLASGSQAISGVGFKPSAIICAFMIINLSRKCSFGGFSDSSLSSNAIIDNGASVADSYQHGGGPFYIQDTSGANNYASAIASYDVDGFTINWTKSGTPTGTATCYCIVVK